MIKLTCDLPRSLYVAFSGGADSRFALDFLSRVNKRHVRAIHIHHGTQFADRYLQHVTEVCDKKRIPLSVHTIDDPPPKGMSAESYWSNIRNKIFQSADMPVVTGHNLDDAVEWWLMRAMNGKQPSLLSSRNGNVLRPFLRFSKIDILKSLGHADFVVDPTNLNGNLRAKVRNGFVDQIDELTSIRSIIRRKYDIPG